MPWNGAPTQPAVAGGASRQRQEQKALVLEGLCSEAGQTEWSPGPSVHEPCGHIPISRMRMRHKDTNDAHGHMAGRRLWGRRALNPSVRLQRRAFSIGQEAAQGTSPQA